LDALRAIAVLLVLGCHVTWQPLWSRCGWTGVDLFFVLSGFLIAGLLFREYKSRTRLDIWRFLTRRAMKIYPAYYVLLIGTLVFDLLRERAISWSNIWPDLFFVQNYRPGLWEHLWSIGTEEQFYLLLPLTFALLILKGRSSPFEQIPVLCMSVMCFCLLARIASVVCQTDARWFPGCIRGFDGIALGVAIAYLSEFRPEYLSAVCKKRTLLLTGSLLCLLPAIAYPQTHPVMGTVGLTLLYFGYAGLLIFFLRFVDGEGRVIRALAFVGSYSYTIYLFHMPVAYYLVPALQFDRNIVFGTYLAVSIVLGTVMAKLIEHPTLRARERLFPSAV
jgi:peptidoglycan/LPS O-acetylase OafA/YrhL